MAYFYSQKMTYCQCMMPREIGWDVMNELGSLECIHFENTSINYDNPYMKSLKRCDEALTKINQIKTFIRSIKIDFKLLQPQSYKDILSQFSHDQKVKNVHGHLYMNDIQEDIQNIHGYLIQQKKQLDGVRKQLNQCVIDAVLLSTVSRSEQLKAVYRDKKQNGGLFDYKCAMINREDHLQIAKGIFRISRGNAWLHALEIQHQSVKALFRKQHNFINQKQVCIVIYQKGQQNVLGNKINRFFSCLESTTLNVSPQRWSQCLQRLRQKIKEIQNVQDLTIDAVQRYLHKLYQPRGGSSVSLLSYLQCYALKQKQIYKGLVYTTASKSFLHFNAYIPSKQLPLQIRPNQNLPPLTMTPKESSKSPPTKFDTPPVLEIPQAILNTYGVPSYGEFNPAVFYIVTFGFFIGVMFGDIGHMMMAIPLLIHFKANVWSWTVVFFMGYCGLIYNEFFGLNLGLFSSCYQIPENLVNDKETTITATEDCVYAFGVDSIWKVATNQMQFTNSLKMKLAVILGVAHMMLGLFVRLINGIRKRDWIDVFTLTIPQTLFMLSTFVYMDYLIFLKWTISYPGLKSAQAPSIIATMIAVYAGFGSDGDYVFWQRQRAFQHILVAIAATMIPLMLLGKPLIIYCKRKGKAEQIPKTQPDEFDNLGEEKMQQKMEQNLEEKMAEVISSQSAFSHKNIEQKDFKPKEEQQSLRQIFVHQFIETIEYVLGTVSNTASYLRLWALSLAHGQLSEVIFELILQGIIKSGYTSIIGLFFAFPFYFLVTFGVLICMDSMQCFLHSLRLHWVQFQNKFYSGKGYDFQAYSFNKIVQKKEQ